MLKVKWEKIMDYDNHDADPIVNWIDLGNGTLFRIIAFFTYRFKGMPRDGLFVAIERIGGFIFDINTSKSWDYVSEKLNILESDARAIADWINVQLGFAVEQQGHYTEHYITNVEPYGLVGERFLRPITPVILKNE